METIEKPTVINSDSAPISEISDKKILSIEEQKEEIRNNYLPSLSSFQKLALKLKDDKNDDTYKEICPDVNYEQSNIGYYIFYNNNLKQLKELYEFELNKLIKNHPVILYHIKKYLNELDTSYDKSSYYDPLKIFSYYISYYSNFNWSIVEKARTLANNLIKIKELEKIGTDIKSYFSQITITDKIEDIFNDINEKNNIYYNSNIYIEIENKFALLEFKYKDKLSYINELEKIFDDYYKEEIGEVSIEGTKKIGFCFVLNRASYYLEQLEKTLQNYDLELLKKCDKLRRKLNILLLENRYKYVQNSKPILDIQIDRFKILNNDFSKISIYLQRYELKQFMKELEKSFQRKADNLSKDNKFEFLSLKQIKEIAVLRDIDINSNESLKDAMKDKIRKLKLEMKAKENKISQIRTEYAKSGITLAVNIALGNELALINEIKKTQITKENNDNNTNKGDNDDILKKKKDEGQSQIDQLQLELEEIKNNIENYNNKLEKININLNYDVTFINILKLYFQLVRYNYQNRNDYEGIIIIEEKKMALIKEGNDLNYHYEEQEKLREYVIKEISKGK